MSHHASDNRIKHSVRSLLRRPPLALAMLGLPGIAFAGPTGEDVVRGAADVVRPNANGTVVNQHTQRAVINWQTFNVDTDEYVIFNQLNSSSVVLNRVIGGDASHILGQIQANGHVFLLNPHGVYFGEGAVLDVQGFLGSTLDMDPDAFMSGDYSLTRNPNSPSTARVINDGQITAGPGGYVVLAGDFTENTGIITAQAGTVALVSGNALTLDIEGDGLVSFAVDEATLSEAAGVRNAGSLIADGGMVVMTAQVANDLVATAVNNEGLVRARSVEEHGGEIYLVGHGGDVENHGTLDADGENADGGRIAVHSDRDVTLANGAVQTAAGDENHAGGMIRVIAEEHLDYQRDNLIRATGGTTGGFVEVSGHGGINLQGIPEIGSGGQLWIDPQHIAIQSGSAAPANDLNTVGSPATFVGATPSYVGASEDVTFIGVNYITGQLNSNVDVTLVASETIFVDASALPSNGLALTATGTGNLNLYIGSVSTGNGAYFGTTVPVITPSTDPDAHQIDLGNLDIDIAGNLTADAGTTGTIELNTAGTFPDMLVDGTVTLNGATITVGQILTNQTVNITGNVAGTNFFVGSSGVGLAAGRLNLTGNVNVTGSVGVWTTGISSTNINVSGNVIATGGGITLDARGSSGATPHINVGGYASAGGNINMTAIGTSIGGGGNITIGSGMVAGGAIGLTANANGGNNGGNITVSAGGISGGGLVNLSATGGTSWGGNIDVTGAGPKGIAGNGVTLTANGSGIASVQNNAVITVSGQIQGGTGNVNISATQTGGGEGGFIDIQGNGSAGVIRGQAVSITASAAGFGANPGRIELGSGSAEFNFTGALVDAVGGDVSISVSGGDGVIVAGAINATGNITLSNSGGQGHIHLGDYAGGSFTGPAALSAGGIVDATMTGSDAKFDAGNITAGNRIRITANAQAGGAGTINVGNLTANGVGVGSTGDIALSVVPVTSGGSSLIAGTVHVDGIAAAQDVTIKIRGASGGFLLDSLNGIANQLTVDTQVGGDIGFANFAGNFAYIGTGTRVDFVGPFVSGGSINVSAGIIGAISGVSMTAGTNLTLSAADGGVSGGNIIFQNGNVTAQNGNVSISGQHTGTSGSGGNVDINGVVQAINGGATITASDSAGLALGGNLRIAGVTANGLTALSANDLGGGSGGDVTVTTSGVHGDSGISIGAANTLGNATVEVTGTILTPGNVTITASGGIVGNEFLVDTSAGGVANLTVNGAINLDSTAIGDVIIWATNNGEVNITGGINAGANSVSIHANGGSSLGSINVGGAIVGGNVTLDAFGGNNGGNIRVGSTGLPFTGASITAANALTLSAQGGNNGGNITVGTLAATTGAIHLTAIGGSGAAGNITVGNLDSLGGLSLPLNVTAGGSLNITQAATATTGAQLQAGTLTAGTNLVMNVSGPGSFNYSALSVSLPTTGNFSYTAAGGSAYSFGSIAAGNILIDITPATAGTTTLTTGNLSATGTGSLSGTVKVNIAAGSTSTGTITAGNVTALNDAIVTVGAFPGAAANGNVTTGTVSAGGLVHAWAPGNVTTGAITGGARIEIMAMNGNIVTGALTAGNSAGNADVYVSTNMGGLGGTITVNGTINVSGAGGSYGQAAGVYLDTGSAGHGITVTGNITVTGAAAVFSNTYSNGSIGGAGVAINAGGGGVSLANVSISGVGEGWLDINGANVALGSVGMNITNGNLTRNFTYGSTECGTTCNLTGKEVLTSGGRASVFIGNNSGVTSTATANFTSITVSAGDADVGIENFGNISGGAISVSATGNQFSQSSTGTYAGTAINYSETANGGGAHLSLMTSAAGTVNLTGAINLAAPGRALLNVAGGTIALSSTTVNVTAGSFTRTGQPAPVGYHDGPFDGDMGSGPGIDEGTIVGGMAAIHVGGYTSASTATGTIMANDVTVTGNLAVSAPGSAQINIAGNNISVSGTLTASGGITTQNGTRSFEYVDSISGDVIVEDSTVASSYGEAEISLTGSSLGSVNAGALTISGPVAGGHVEGGNLTVGGLTITGTGGNVDVVETTTNQTTGEVTNFEFHGPALLSGFGIEGTGTVTVGGAINITAVGGGGTIISGNSVSLQDVSVTITDGAYQILDPSVFGASMHSFTLGDAILDINATTTATAGNITVNASQVAYHGGSYTATGAINVSAGAGMRQLVRNEVQYLNAINDDGGSGSPIALTGPLNATATSIDISTTTEGLNLAQTALTATLGINIAAGGNVILSDANLSAGGALTISAGGGVANAGTTGAISADALLIDATTGISLANTGIAVGTGTTGFAGDSAAVAYAGLLAGTNPNAVFNTAGTLTLGNVTVSGNYLYAAANAFSGPAAISVTPGALVQIQPFTSTNSFGIGGGAGGTATTALNTVPLSGIAGATFVFGGNAFTGDIQVGDPAAVDLTGNDVVLLTAGNVSGTNALTAASVTVNASTISNLSVDSALLTIDTATSASYSMLASNATVDISAANLDSMTGNFSGNGTLLGGFAGTVLDITASGSFTLGGGVLADSFTLQATSANFSGQTIDLTGAATFNLGTNLVLTDTVLNAGTVEINAGGNVSNGGTTGSITANGAAISAGGNVNLANTAFTIGSAAAPGAIGDTYLLSLLSGEGLAPSSAAPNLFIEGNSVTLGDLTFNGDYLYLEADTLTFAGAVTTSQADTLVQLAPRLATSTISVVQSGSGAGAVDYSNTGHLALFAGRTVAIGTTDHTGDITLSENTADIDIGSTNLFVLTSGTVTGLDKVLSTGVVKDLDTLLGLGFTTPQTDEIDVKQDSVETLSSEYELETQQTTEEEEEGDEEGEDTNSETVTEEEDSSLIRQETADEEMMCR